MSAHRQAQARPGLVSRLAPVVDAPRLEGAMARARAGEFFYTVVSAPVAPARRPVAAPEPPPRSSGSTEKRRAVRQRVRLRTGKIIDAAGRLVGDCLIFDRSDTGSRLRLPAGVTLRLSSFHFYDDQQSTLHQADIVWRQNRDIGVRFRTAAATPQARVFEDTIRKRFRTAPK